MGMKLNITEELPAAMPTKWMATNADIYGDVNRVVQKWAVSIMKL
jgi:hypothetical protein